MAAKEKKGLGTGLDVLFGADEYEDFGSEQMTLPISKVEPRIEQPREYFDEQALQELAESIEQYGLIQPITVRKLDSGYYQIIAGERRWRAARIAGLEEVPVRIIEADDRRTAELALVENLQREDLNPIEEAKGYKTLMEEYGLTQDETAKSVGKSRPAIANAIRLLSLSPKVLELVESGQLSAGHARALIPICDHQQQLDAAKEVLDKSLTVRRTEELSSRIAKGAVKGKNTASAELPVDYSAEVADRLSGLLGRKVKLTNGRRIGKIELEFYGSDDRELLLENLRRMGETWTENK